METIYLDNAATTPILPEVIDLICENMTTVYGNPSSTHQIGRKAKSLVETARKNIAKHFNAQASEIIFTAGATEANNLVLHNAVLNLGVTEIISSKIEHHAVLHTLDYLIETYKIKVRWVRLNNEGTVNLEHLEQLLQQNSNKKMVSLMYVNNEIGNVLPVDKVAALCKEYQALFHSDAVQAVGHFNFDVQKTRIDFFVASAHKFHGPKGVGFAFVKKGFGIVPMLHGGEQEKGARAGTENLYSIIGMELALNIAYSKLNEEAKYISNLKNYFIEKLKDNFEEIQFNGTSLIREKGSYIILNVRFGKEIPMLLFNLDLKGIAVSGGSACQSGSNKGSHVLNEILNETEAKKTSVRFSFSKFNKREEIDKVILILKELVKE